MTRWFSFFLGLLFLLPVSARTEELRTWRDVNGRTLEATFEGARGNAVLLRMKDGREISFPISRLSEEDREIVNGWAASDPAFMAGQIDQMILVKLKEEYQEVRKEMAEVPGHANWTAKDRERKMAELQLRMKLTLPPEPATDEQFLRRIYLQIAGRIPTYEEAVRFLQDSDANKRSKLIDELLESEAFVSHFFNYLSDLLRIRSQINPDNRFLLFKTAAYSDWVKDQIRKNRPWDEFVAELIAAEGYFFKNPASGYLLTDFGMELCNLSNTFTVFTGLEITCAQCHDHPYEEVYQMDFYKLAAFFGQLNFESKPESRPLESGSAADEASLRVANAPSQIQSEYRFYLADDLENRIRLPLDYKYNDGDPGQRVRPSTYFGESLKMEEFENPREAFAAWLTSKENPRFTINIVNRLWKEVFGYGQVEPVDNLPGHLDNQAQNYELLKFLEEAMRTFDYDIRAFLRMLYHTKTFQRQCCEVSPTDAMVSRGEFPFPSPVLRRMTAEQYWDSLVTLATGKPEQTAVRILDEYREIMELDWRKVPIETATRMAEEYDRMGGDGMRMYRTADGEYTYPENDGELLHLRAAERKLPADVGTFLYLFGQSQKEFIEADSQVGSIPQALYLLNGDLTNRLVSTSQRHLIQVLREEPNSAKAIERAFISILSRKPSATDLSFAKQLLHGGDGNPDYGDVIWALLNLHEFRFIQ